MGITIDQRRARARLLEAVDWALDGGRPVPGEWLEITEHVSASAAKTMVAFLGTALLARATDDRVDALAIKQNYSEASYSARTLCHSVLVPVSKAPDHPFHLGAMGREPLNNQPFFRFDHVDSIDRARSPDELDYLRDRLRELNQCGSDDALAALAAFLRSRMNAQKVWDEELRALLPGHTEVAALLDNLEDFLREGTPDRPLRLQAVVGGLVRLTNLDVSSQGINDPSRHAPGDVHVPDEREPHWAAEIRGKPVPLHEALDFVNRCATSDSIRSCWLIVLAAGHQPLDRSAINGAGHARGLLTVIVEDLVELVAAIAGHPAIAPGSLNYAGTAILEQLGNMRASQVTLGEWRTAWTV